MRLNLCYTTVVNQSGGQVIVIHFYAYIMEIKLFFAWNAKDAGSSPAWHYSFPCRLLPREIYNLFQNYFCLTFVVSLLGRQPLASGAVT